MTARNIKNRPLLNVHAILPLSHANGPGARAVVWVQGCRRKCPGCCNPQTHSHGHRHLIDPQNLARAILAIPGIEGLTVSGGEPFEQAEAVGVLCRKVRENGLSVMVFTGRTHERIRASRGQAVQDLLAQIDILVDGPFIQELADNHLIWRGSRNQRVLFLSNRHDPEVLDRGTPTAVEARLALGSPLGVTGFPEGSDVQFLAKCLRLKSGILLEPLPTEKSNTRARRRNP